MAFLNVMFSIFNHYLSFIFELAIFQYIIFFLVFCAFIKMIFMIGRF